MASEQKNTWARFKECLFYNGDLRLILDFSRMGFEDSFLTKMEPEIIKAFAKTEELEKGAIANPDENRMVGHYWLRNPDLAPSQEIAGEIHTALAKVKEFTEKIHSGRIKTEKGDIFKNILLIGIGGSSLGPKFAADALASPQDKMKTYYLDNTDPDGMDRVFQDLYGKMDQTLIIVISKSGGTIETRNGMLETQRIYQQEGLDFAKHAVSITQEGSKLDEIRKDENWLAAFPMWDWVGGRTSVLSAVGLLPLALQGINIGQLLKGARECDEQTRSRDIKTNPAALLALMWYYATGGKGGRQMVMLPYKDRLELFSKYLQQLIMESLGKEKDLAGNWANQGITVFGNKGSTDQHSYLQQLLDGPDNFFVTFIEVLKDRDSVSRIISQNSTSGDYLQAFFLGTRKALAAKGKESITITVDQINEFSLGVLIALFERTVTLYAYLVNINAYHQPAVELGKRGAGEVIALKNAILTFLNENKGSRYKADEIAEKLGLSTETETVFKILLHLQSNPDHGVKCDRQEDVFRISYWV